MPSSRSTTVRHAKAAFNYLGYGATFFLAGAAMVSCSLTKLDASSGPIRFDKKRWSSVTNISDPNNWKRRMESDLIFDVIHKGMKVTDVKAMLGEPDGDSHSMPQILRDNSVSPGGKILFYETYDPDQHRGDANGIEAVFIDVTREGKVAGVWRAGVY
ncbi:MAG TPA: hypothetical protein VG944_24630 [Fimbriimonas sp.]|nr:hypothetical protein [Fimbriimonas sp.]